MEDTQHFSQNNSGYTDNGGCPSFAQQLRRGYREYELRKMEIMRRRRNASSYMSSSFNKTLEDFFGMSDATDDDPFADTADE